MLRQNATCITLDASDIDWHNRRREDRLAKLARPASGKQSAQAMKTDDVEVQSPGAQRKAVPDEPPNELHSQFSEGDGKDPDIPIYSDEPVPQDSQEFWAQVIRDAGPSARLHHAPLGRTPQVIVPSAAFLENNGSVHLSVRGQDEDGHGPFSEQTPGEALASPMSPVPSSSGGNASTQVFSRLSPRPVPPFDSEEDNDQGSSDPKSPTPLDSPSPPTYEDGSHNPEETDSRPSAMGRDRGNRSARFNQLDVDGPSDAVTSSSPQSSIPPLPGREDGTDDMLRWSHWSNHIGTLEERLESTSRAMTRADRGMEEIRSLLRSDLAQKHRVRSGGLPQSRLRIAETATSSSPEKDPEPQHSTGSPDDDDPLQPSSILPRRRKDYKRRSETYSYTPSEASASYESSPAIAGPSTNPPNPNSEDEFSFANLEHGGSFFTLPARDTTDLPHEPTRASMNASHRSSSGNSRRHRRSGRLNEFTRNWLSSTATNANSSPSTNRPPDPSELPRPFEHQQHHGAETEARLPRRSTTRVRPPPILIPMNSLTTAQNNMMMERYLRSTSNENNRADLGDASRASAAEGRYNADAGPYHQFMFYQWGLPSTYVPSTDTTPTPVPTTTTPSRMTVYNDSLSPSTQPQTPQGLPRRGIPRTAPVPFRAYVTAAVPHDSMGNTVDAGIEGS
ncbi:MAG: hypothetical protein Q9174_003643, partial [Haloplaca sp. 1 TL-2023]